MPRGSEFNRHQRVRIHPASTAQGHLSSKINYRTTGFRPEHLRTLDLGEDEIYSLKGFNLDDTDDEYWRKVARERIAERDLQRQYAHKSYTGIGETFQVFESEAGEGAAAWNMKRNHDGTWTIRLRGTRGDSHTITTASPDMTARAASSFFERRIKPKRLANLAKTSGSMSRSISPNAQVNDAETHRSSRVDFMARLIAEGGDFSTASASRVEELNASRERLAFYARDNPGPEKKSKRGRRSAR